MSDKSTIGIVDYKSGNSRSVVNAIEFLGYDYVFTDDKTLLKKCTHIVLPGVGSFSNAMDNLQDKKLVPLLEEIVLQDKRFFLGICVGMQILAEIGEEFGVHSGLGWIKGKTQKLSSNGLRLPHIGWNEISDFNKEFVLFRGLPDCPTFCFVHSYEFFPDEKTLHSGHSDYGERFLSALQKENIFCVQFHPEKSQRNGLKLLANFCEL